MHHMVGLPVVCYPLVSKGFCSPTSVAIVGHVMICGYIILCNHHIRVRPHVVKPRRTLTSRHYKPCMQNLYESSPSLKPCQSHLSGHYTLCRTLSCVK